MFTHSCVFGLETGFFRKRDIMATTDLGFIIHNDQLGFEMTTWSEEKLVLLPIHIVTHVKRSFWHRLISSYGADRWQELT